MDPQDPWTKATVAEKRRVGQWTKYLVQKFVVVKRGTACCGAESESEAQI